MCTNCNNDFSRAFEQTIANRFSDFRRLLLIPDRYGQVPELFVTIEADGETLDAKLLNDGRIQMKPVVTVVRQNGVTEVTYRHATQRQQERLRAEALNHGVEVIEEHAEGRDVEVNIAGELDFLNAPEMLRTVAKIAYTALALLIGSESAGRDVFADARAFIRTGEGVSPARLFLHEEFLAACAQGPHQHSVVLVGARENRRVEAIVRLFGALCYFVTLADNYEGADFYHTLVYNAQRGQVNDILVVDLQAEFRQVEEVRTSQQTIWDNRERSGRAFLRFIAQALNAELHE